MFDIDDVSPWNLNQTHKVYSFYPSVFPIFISMSYSAVVGEKYKFYVI